MCYFKLTDSFQDMIYVLLSYWQKSKNVLYISHNSGELKEH